MTGRVSGSRAAALLAATAIAGISGAMIVPRPSLAQVAEQQTHQFSIAAKPIRHAMNDIVRTTGINVVFPETPLASSIGRPVNGTMTASQAIGALLAGSGLRYSYANGNTITITDQASQDSDAMSNGDETTLAPIVLRGGRVGPDGSFTPDTPYETPGGVSHISRDQIDRVAPTSPGDMFSSTPGVLNGGNRVGNSLNPNIRGLQGMGRVATTVDGALNSSTSYRGYSGTRDESYVDPDMIGGIDITKGPGDGAGGSAIGGSIAMRTLNAEDLVKEGDNWGMRFKGGIGSNTLSAPYKPEGIVSPKVRRETDRPGGFNGDSWSGSVAAATLQDNFEGVLAISRRLQGNYFAGRNNVPGGFIFSEGNAWVPGQNATVRPGAEVYNTSEETNSVLAKAKVKWGDGQFFELGYMLYDSLAGEEDEALISGPGINNLGQLNLSRTRLDSYTARYRNQPSDNPLVDLRANLWHTKLDHDRGQAYPLGIRDHDMATTGGDISNRSIIDMSYGTLTFDAGAEFRHESAEAPTDPADMSSRGPNGVRTLASGFGKLSFDPTDWLTLSAGARFDYYEAAGQQVYASAPDRSGSRLSPNFGVTLKPLDGFQVFAQYKEGYRAPSLRELYWELYTLQINPDLQGEVSKNWEFGFNVLQDNVLTAGDKLGFKASYFRNRYDNFIVTDNVPGSFGAAQHFTNIDRANYHGIELSATYDTGIFFAEGAFTKYLTAEYCTPERGCYTPQLNDVLANVTPANYVPPDWSGSVTAGFRMFDEALTIGGRATFSSVRSGSSWPPTNSGFGLIGLQYTWPEFVVFDLFGSYKFSEDTMLNFSVENLTDQYYYGPLSTTGMPSPGRTARITFTHRIGGAGFVNMPEITSLGKASFGAPGDDWTGLYVGGHFGQAFGNVSGTATMTNGSAISPTEFPDFSDGKRTLGAQIGHNWQLENGMVLGFEGDFSILNQSGGKSRTYATDAGYLDSLQSETEYQLDWTANLKGRLGYSFGRLMVYGTAGLSLMQQSGSRTQYQANSDESGTEPLFAETDSAIKLGWSLGAGAEYALTSHWSIRGEYSYSSYSATSLSFSQAREGVTRNRWGIVGYETWDPDLPPEPVYGTIPGTSPNIQGRQSSAETGIHSIKIGLNYRF
ncbi:TonB-dependent receptor domain-containing protein [Neorhizobium sp. DT-125]|uniref:TonB-dependent receptor domain-containing protein n=1 Tax=Neorhizobium sp. DT-125 TaxID=3396163 RepID=UPI003F1D4DF5